MSAKEQLLTLLDIAPDKEKEERFFSCFKELKKEDQIFVLERIKKNPIGASWYHVILNHPLTASFYSLDRKDRDVNIPLINSIFVCIQCTLDKNLIADYKRIVMEAVKREDLADCDITFYTYVLDFILSELDLLNQEEMISFIVSRIQREDGNIVYLESGIVYYYQVVKKACFCSKAKLFETIFNSKIGITKENAHQVFSCLSYGYQKEMLFFAIDLLLKNEKELEDIDCFFVIDNKINRKVEHFSPALYDSIRIILSLMHSSFTKADLLEIFDTLSQSDQVIKRQLAIYFYHYHFKEFHSGFGFEPIVRLPYLGERPYYSEIYALLEEHFDEWKEKDYLEILKYIEAIKDEDRLYELYRKIEVVELFICQSDAFVSLREKLFYSFSLTEEISLLRYPIPLNVSRKTQVFGSSFGYLPLDCNLKRMNKAEYLSYLAKSKEYYDFERRDIEYRLKEDYSRFHLDDLLVDESYDLNQFSFEFIESLIGYDFEYSKTSYQRCYQILKHLNTLKDWKEVVINYFAFTFCCLCPVVDEEQKEEKAKIFDLLFSILMEDIDSYFPSHMVPGSYEFYMVSWMLNLMNSDQWKKIKPILEEEMKEEEKKDCFFSLLLNNEKDIASFDPDFFKNHYDYLFKDILSLEEETKLNRYLDIAENEITDSYLLERWIDDGIFSDFYQVLEKRKMTDILDDYSSYLLECYFVGRVSFIVAKFVLQVTHFKNFDQRILSIINHSLKPKKDRLKELLAYYEFYIDRGSTIDVVRFLQLGKKYPEVKDICLRIVEKLCAYGFDMSYIENINLLFVSPAYFNEDRIRILLWITKHLEIVDDFTDYYKWLIDQIDWSCNQDKLQELMAELKDIDLKFAEKIYRYVTEGK